MRTNLAVKNLLSDPRRFLVAVTGVSFATTLVLMQLGFFGAILGSAVLIYDRLEFDVVLRSPSYVVLAQSDSFPEDRLATADTVPGVERVTPLWAGMTVWRNPVTAVRRPILVLGVDPERLPFHLAGEQNGASGPELAARLRQSGSVLIDTRSRKEFGPQGTPGETIDTEVNGSAVRIVGRFTMGTGFTADGAVLANRGTFRRISNGEPGRVSLGLVRVAAGSDPATVAAQLAAALPPDVVALTRPEARLAERWHWILDESLGTIFAMGLAVSVVVGVAVVYQLLSAEITDRFAEYATLKAMGYRPAFLGGVILQQAALLACAAFPPSLLVAGLLDWAARTFANVPVELWPWRIATALVLTVSMCVGSGLLSIRKVQTADPAELF